MNITIYPCLWFDDEAKAAASHYCKLFKHAKMGQQNDFVSSFELMGTKFMALNGGPKYKMNEAMSYYVYCGSEAEIERLYVALIKDGHVNIPLDSYPWSAAYAWVIDAFGLSWQLDIDNIRTAQKIVPSLLFVNEKADKVKEAITHYTGIFDGSAVLLESPHPAGAGMPDGALLFAQFKLDGWVLNAMSSAEAHDFDFTPGNSLVVECETQAEIDHCWENLGEGGRYDRCGWLQDRYGVSWQIIPKVLSQLMADPERSARVGAAFMKMQKFDIEALMKA